VATKKRRKRAAEMPTCVAVGCGQKVAMKGLRGLCKDCFANPAVREAVEVAVPVRKATGGGAARPLPVPTAIRPGPNSGKVEVLAERVRLRQQLFHPDDAK